MGSSASTFPQTFGYTGYHNYISPTQCGNVILYILEMSLSLINSVCNHMAIFKMSAVQNFTLWRVFLQDACDSRNWYWNHYWLTGVSCISVCHPNIHVHAGYVMHIRLLCLSLMRRVHFKTAGEKLCKSSVLAMNMHSKVSLRDLGPCADIYWVF